MSSFSRIFESPWLCLLGETPNKLAGVKSDNGNSEIPARFQSSFTLVLNRSYRIILIILFRKMGGNLGTVMRCIKGSLVIDTPTP